MSGPPFGEGVPFGPPPSPPGYQPHQQPGEHVASSAFPGYQPYAPPQYHFRPQVRVNGMCAASLVLGILGLACFFLYAVVPLLAIVFGAIGIGQVERSGGEQSGRGVGIAGLVLGIVGLCLAVFLFTVLARSWSLTALR